MRPTARFHHGTFAGAAPTELRVDGVGHRVLTAGRHWWAVVPVPGPADLVLHAPDGDTLLEHVDEPAPPVVPGGSRIAVCMATFEPDPELFAAQVESLHAQTDTDWICVVSDDASSSLEPIRAVLGDDPRFVLHPSEQRRGFNANFERALGLAPPDCGFVALCDQDDRWHPGKLARLRAAMRAGVTLAFCDSRLVDAGGRVLRDTLWAGRAVNHTDLTAMLVANSVTGAAALLRRDVADLALPFPEPPGIRFHDHWLACVALAAGELAYVDEPLYDYVQHRGAVFGDVATGGVRARKPSSARAQYFYGYVARAVYAHALLGRCDPAPDKRRALERFIDADGSPVELARLAARGVRAPNTLGAELDLARGLVWRRFARDGAIPPPGDFEQRRLRRWRAAVSA